MDLVDRPLRDRDCKDVAVRSGLDVSDNSEIRAEEQCLTLRNCVDVLVV
jgi:hypothetical protein